MRNTFNVFATVFMIIFTTSACSSGKKEDTSDENKNQTEVIRKHRDDGTLSSVSQVDEKGYAHGIKVNYYEDGKTVHSKVSYQHGRKHGPAIWYFRSGQIYEQTSFHFGRRDGITKRYYEDGTLMEEITYEQGEELPGKKVYDRDGTLITE